MANKISRKALRALDTPLTVSMGLASGLEASDWPQLLIGALPVVPRRKRLLLARAAILKIPASSWPAQFLYPGGQPPGSSNEVGLPSLDSALGLHQQHVGYRDIKHQAQVLADHWRHQGMRWPLADDWATGFDEAGISLVDDSQLVSVQGAALLALYRFFDTAQTHDGLRWCLRLCHIAGVSYLDLTALSYCVLGPYWLRLEQQQPESSRYQLQRLLCPLCFGAKTIETVTNPKPKIERTEHSACSLCGGYGSTSCFDEVGWLQETPVRLAQAALIDHKQGGTERLLLADCLEDAGLSMQLALDHLRGCGPHAVGCWPVDLTLGYG